MREFVFSIFHLKYSELLNTEVEAGRLYRGAVKEDSLTEIVTIKSPLFKVFGMETILMIEPVILYVAEMWTLTNGQEKWLEVIISRLFRPLRR